MRRLIVMTLIIMVLAGCSPKGATDKQIMGHVLVMQGAIQQYNEAAISQEEHNRCMNDVTCDIIALEVASEKMRDEMGQIILEESAKIDSQYWPENERLVLQELQE